MHTCCKNSFPLSVSLYQRTAISAHLSIFEIPFLSIKYNFNPGEDITKLSSKYLKNRLEICSIFHFPGKANPNRSENIDLNKHQHGVQIQK